MSTISLTDFKRKSAKNWLASSAQAELVLTANGEPIALILPLSSSSIEDSKSILRSIRALRAQARLQKASERNGVVRISMSEIDGEISSSRHDRRGR